MTAAPSMAEVLADHRADEVARDCLPADDGRVAWVYARYCGCGWRGPSDRHDAHVAQALADAGFGHVASVEAERDAYREAVEASTRELNDCAFAHGNGRPAILIRLEAAEAQVAAVRALADHWGRVGGPDSPRAYATRLLAALDGEATP